MRFSLVIPCFNEAKNLPLLLERCKVLANRIDVEVIFVNNGSIDSTKEILSELLPLYPGYRTVDVKKNQGYGFGILSGLKASRGEVLGWTHADMQADPLDTLTGLKLFEKHGDDIFVKGKRYGRKFKDITFTVGMSLFETVLLKYPMWDINAQPTMFARSFLEKWEDPPSDFSLDLYAYFIAKSTNCEVHRFPVKFGNRAHGTSHWNINFTEKKKFIQRTIDFSFKLKKKLSK